MTIETIDEQSERIKQEVLAEIDLEDTGKISGYGSIPSDREAEALLDIAQSSPVTVLARCLEDIANALRNANPNVLMETPGLLSRFTCSSR